MNEQKIRRDKYTEAYTQFFPMVYNVVHTKIGNEVEADDICQEIFIAFYEKFDRIDNHRKWLHGTMRNVIMKHFRDKKENVDVDEIFYDISLTFVNGFRDTRVIIEDAIEESIQNEEERMLVEMISFHNYTYEHVARVMDLTRRKVVYRYGELVKRILHSLKGQGIKNIEDIL